MPGLLTCKPKIFAGNVSWAPEKQQDSSHLVLTDHPPNAPRSLWRLLGGRGTAHLWGNMWSCTTSLASATGTSLSCATEYAGYSDLQANSSPGLESRFRESTPVSMQGKIRMGISKWPYKKFPGRRKAPLKQACWKWSQSGLLFWLKAWHRSTALLCWDGQHLSEGVGCLQFLNTINKAPDPLLRHSVAHSASFYLTT